jgi:hypothetical protein
MHRAQRAAVRNRGRRQPAHRVHTRHVAVQLHLVQIYQPLLGLGALIIDTITAVADAVGTRSAAFSVDGQHVTVVTNPLRCVAMLTQHSDVFVIGADRGSGITKPGVSHCD